MNLKESWDKYETQLTTICLLLAFATNFWVFYALYASWFWWKVYQNFKVIYSIKKFEYEQKMKKEHRT